jgi:hypothetical protein
MIRKISSGRVWGSPWWRSVGPVSLALVLLPGFAVDAADLLVSPGTLVRWPGEGVERCGLAGQTWLPLRDGCWYAIDLLTPEGETMVYRWRGGEREARALTVGAYPYEVQHITLKDDSQVELSPEDLRRVQKENQQIGLLWGMQTTRQFDLPLGPPLNPLPAGGRFGARRYFNNQPRSPHTGADYRADAGTPVLAIGGGTIALTGDFFFPGKSVFIDHGDGLISMYFHLSGIAVERGDIVDRGEIVGLVGESGRATGPHLHLGVRWHGARIDPGLLFESPEAVPVLP